MSGETETEVSAFTVDSLHLHLDSRINGIEKLLLGRIDELEKRLEERAIAQEKAVDKALKSQEKAVKKSEAASEKRFDSVNEFRRTLSDQQTLFLPRSEYAANHQNLADRVTDVTDRINRNEGKGQGYAALYGWAVGAIGLILTVVVIANQVFGR